MNDLAGPAPRWFLFLLFLPGDVKACIVEGDESTELSTVEPEWYLPGFEAGGKGVVLVLAAPLAEEEVTRDLRAMIDGGPSFFEKHEGIICNVYEASLRPVRAGKPRRTAACS